MQRRGPPIAFTKSLISAPSHIAAAPAPVFVPPPSNAPSAFYQQHHAVEAPAINEREFRPAWRVKSRLMLLLEYGRIDRRQLEAATVFRAWCEAVGRQRGATWLAPRVDGGRAPENLIAPNQLEAARRLDAARLALGRDRIKLLFWALVDELPWDRIAQRLGVSGKTATCRAVEAIAALTLWRSGQPVPPAPVNRRRIEPGRW